MRRVDVVDLNGYVGLAGGRGKAVRRRRKRREGGQ
jgi:hypothetical protein